MNLCTTTRSPIFSLLFATALLTSGCADLGSLFSLDLPSPAAEPAEDEAAEESSEEAAEESAEGVASTPSGDLLQDADESGLCEDSDGGLNSMVAGFTTGNDEITGEFGTYFDSCSDEVGVQGEESGTWVVEKHCSELGDYVHTQWNPCAFGCLEGACRSEPEPEPEPVDEDADGSSTDTSDENGDSDVSVFSIWNMAGVPGTNQVQVSDAVTEGSPVVFRIQRSGNTSVGNSVRFLTGTSGLANDPLIGQATSSENCTSGVGCMDYESRDELVFFAPGETMQTIYIDTYVDSAAELTEYFRGFLRETDPNTSVGFYELPNGLQSCQLCMATAYIRESDNPAGATSFNAEDCSAEEESSVDYCIQCLEEDGIPIWNAAGQYYEGCDMGQWSSEYTSDENYTIEGYEWIHEENDNG